MANGLGKLMNFLKLTDEDDEFDDDFYDDYDDGLSQRDLEKEERRLAREKRREEKRTPSYREPSYREDDDFSYERETTASAAPRRASTSTFRSASSGKVVQMPSSSGGDMEVCIVKPANIGEAQQVCTLLMEQHPVVVNLEGIDLMEAQRIMDFISGCIYAISGNMCQVSRYIFIFSPKDIDISGDYIKSLENEESYNIASFSKEF